MILKASVYQKIEFLAYIKSKAEILKTNEHYFTRVAFEKFEQEMIAAVSNKLPKTEESFRLFEALYQSLDSISDQRYKTSFVLNFHTLVETLGAVPLSIQKDIKAWSAIHGHSYLLDPLLKAPAHQLKSACLSIY